MQNSDKYDINLMCECLNVSRSGFYRFFYASSGKMKEKKFSVCMRILSLHASDPFLGAPRITLLLHGEGIQIAQSTVYRQQSQRCHHQLSQYRLDYRYNIYPYKGRLGISIHNYRQVFAYGHCHEYGLFNVF